MSREEFSIVEGNNEEIKLAIRNPQYEDHEEADRKYAMKVASLIKDNFGRKLLSRSDLNKYLKESGAWTEQDEKDVKRLQEEIDSILNKIRKGGTKESQGRAWAIESMDKRNEMVRIMRKRQMFDDSTIESIAENEKIDYIIYSSTVYADSGSNYWDSFDDMKNDKLSEAYRKASVLAMKVIFDVNPEFEKNLPENKWLAKHGFIDENLNYVDKKTGEKVDRHGNPIKDLEEAVKKQIDNIQGDLTEEQPFVDDETNEPVVIGN